MSYIVHFWYSIPTLSDIINNWYMRIGHLTWINRLLKALIIMYLTAILVLPKVYPIWGFYLSYTLLVILLLWVMRHDGINVNKKLCAEVRKQMAGFDKFTLQYHNTTQFVILVALGVALIIII